MDPDRYKKIDEIFQKALSQAPEKLEPFLRDACAGDEELRHEVDSLLEHNRQLGSFIESPARVSTAPTPAVHPEPNLAGRNLSHYRLVQKIGEGGMGVVYRAEDLRLKRTVAIKLLPAERVSDPERKRRFVKEARAASALNHPNIVTIYDIDQAEGIDFIAMEYVAGRTLDRQIPEHGMPVGSVLDLGIQMADALEAAHSAGIVHRDFKPANIAVTQDRRVKILDFGLAKLLERAEPGPEGSMPADTSFRTERGMVLGTAAYMSPEQAQARKVDARSDIFSFGAVLYEMASGQRAFEADSTVALLAAIIRDEPRPLCQLAPRVPAEFEKLIRRCLNKEPERRFQAISDVRVELQEIKSEIGKPATQPAAGRLRRLVFRVSLIAAGVFAVAGATYWLSSGRDGPKQVERPLSVLTGGEGLQTQATWSPDGKYIAYAAGDIGNFDIMVKEVGGGEPGKLNGADDPTADDWQPDWSPDGKQIVFRSERDGGGLYLVSAPFGGPAKRLIPGGYRPRWSPDGRRILFVTGAGRAFSPEPKLLSLDRMEVSAIPGLGKKSPAIIAPYGVRWHPDGRLSILDIYDPRFFWTQDLDGKGRSAAKGVVVERVKKLEWSWDPFPEFEWSPSGDALFFVASSQNVRDLWKVDVDPKTLEWLGGPHRLTTSPDSETGLAVSRSGRLAFSLQRTTVRLWSFPFDPQTGALKGDGIRIRNPGVVMPESDLSADGQRLALITDEPGTGQRIWGLDFGDDRRTVLAEGDQGYWSPRWSRDGRYLAYSCEPNSLFTVPAAGGQRHLTFQAWEAETWDWFPDDKAILAGYFNQGLFKLRAFSDAPPAAALFAPGPRDAPRFSEKSLVVSGKEYVVTDGRFSPDGRWVAFAGMQYSLDATRPGAGPGRAAHIFVVSANRKSDGDRLASATSVPLGEGELTGVLVTYLLFGMNVDQIASALKVHPNVVRNEMDGLLAKHKMRDLREVSQRLDSRLLADDWVPITEGDSRNLSPRWAPDGKTLYFISDGEGSINVRGRRFDPKQGKPVGDPFQLTRFAGPARALGARDFSWCLSVGPQRLVLPLEEVSGNLWVLENASQ